MLCNYAEQHSIIESIKESKSTTLFLALKTLSKLIRLDNIKLMSTPCQVFDDKVIECQSYRVKVDTITGGLSNDDYENMIVYETAKFLNNKNSKNIFIYQLFNSLSLLTEQLENPKLISDHKFAEV